MTTNEDPFERIKKQHANIKRKISRLEATGDIKRLIRLRAELEKVRESINEIKPEIIEATMPEFRKSYGYEFFMQDLLAGRKRKPMISPGIIGCTNG